MRKTNKLVALLLALVMVLGMLPATTAHAHGQHGALQPMGIEEYPEIELNAETPVSIDEPGKTVYFRFTPSVTAEYTFASHDTTWSDPQGYLYDSEMNLLAKHEDNGFNPETGVNDLNFTLVYTMEANVTYVLATNLYNAYYAGRSYTVTLTADLPAEHNYEGVVTVEPTCTTDGVMTYTCTDCGDTYTEVIPGGHTYVGGFCTRCGEEFAISGVCGDNVTWALTGSGVMTISGTGDMYDFSLHYEPMIPWADNLNDIKTIVVEEGVTSIGSFAFMNAAYLTSVTMADSVATVGESAFRNCYGLEAVTFGKDLTTIEPFAFMNCQYLTAVDLQEVVTIGNSAFYACYRLSELDLGNSLTAIDTLAFSECHELTEVTMPDSVTAMGSDVFSGCTALTSAKLSNALTDLPKYTFNECTNLENVTMPEYLTTIGERAFYCCSSLETVQLPFSMIAIGDDAFGHCTSLKDIQFPMALSYVGYFAFNGCTSLTNVEFPPNLTYFTGGCFYNCTGLTELVFPEAITYVDDDAFAGCTNVKKIVFTGSLPTILGAFIDVTADAWYPAGNETWTEDMLMDYGGDLTWHAMCENHSFGKWTPVVDATCTEGGIDERVCSVCEWTEERVSEPAGHIWDEGTENENGEMVYTCLICGETTDEKPFVNPFTDVNVGDFFYESVLWAVQNGITTGATETTFDPEGDCLRASVVTFLWRAAGEPEPTTTNNPFTDVSEKDFFYKAVLWAVEEGITNGTSATEFSPYKECNRAAVVTFLYRAMGEPEVTNTTNPFTDVDVDQFYGPAVLWAVENGVTNGMGDGTFGIEKTCNRAQVVTFLYRAAQLSEEEPELPYEPEEPEQPVVPAETYELDLRTAGFGTVEYVDGKTTAAAGESIFFYAIPIEGYYLDHVGVFNPDGAIDVTTIMIHEHGDDLYELIMIPHDLIMTCYFYPIG